MVFFVDIQIAVFISRFLTDQCTHGLIRTVLSPVFQYIHLFQSVDSQHLEERNGIRNITARFDLVDFQHTHLFCHMIHLWIADHIKVYISALVSTFSYPIDATEFLIILNDKTTLTWQFLIRAGKDHSRYPKSCTALVQILGDHLGFQHLRFFHQDHIMRIKSFRRTEATLCALCPVSQNLCQRIQDIINL